MAFKRKKKWKFWLLFGILIIIILGLLIAGFLKFGPFVPLGNEKNITKPYVDSAIYKEFEKGSEWVKVFVGFESKEAMNSVISKLPKSEIQVITLSLRGDSFSGEVTRKGLEILSKNQKVKWLNLVKPMDIGLNESVPLIQVRNSVWNLGYTGEGKTVCIIDTGVNYSHPDFGGCTEAYL